MMEKLDLHPHLIRQVLKLSFVLICNNSITSFENGSLYSKQRIYSRYPGWIFMHFWNFSVCILMMLSTDKFCFWQAATDWHSTQGVYWFCTLHCTVLCYYEWSCTARNSQHRGSPRHCTKIMLKRFRDFMLQSSNGDGDNIEITVGDQ